MQERKIKKKQFDRFLVCSLCDGYFRFAHTIAECGHTFCKICIFQYIKNKNMNHEKITCPNCKADLVSYFKETIKKDTYKQSLVDIIHPQFSIEEQKVTKRVKQLFPEIDLEYILDEFNYDNIGKQIQRAKIQKNNNDDQFLPNLVQKQLNMDFNQFVDKIYDEKQFEQLKVQISLLNKQNYAKKQIKPQEETKLPVMENDELVQFNLFPMDDTQFGIVNLRNILKLKGKPDREASVLDVKQFIVKRTTDSYLKNILQQYKINKSKIITENVYIYLNLNQGDLIQDTMSLKQIKTQSNDQVFTLGYQTDFLDN